MWAQQVDTKYKPLAQVLINHCDWSWTQSVRLPDNKPLSPSHIADYQVFILCKVIAGDLKVDAETKRLRLSPTEQIDEVWHLHLLRPGSYFEMCWKLHEAKQELGFNLELPAEDKIDVEALEGKEDAVQGEGSLLPDKTFHPLDFVIDHTPESSDDSDIVKYERYKVTKSYLVKLCPGYIFSNPQSGPSPGQQKALDPYPQDCRSTPDSNLGLFDDFFEEEDDMDDPFIGDEEGPPLTLRIRTLTGAVHEISGLNTNMKVVDLMRRYQAMEGVPVDQQRYIFRGRQMNEEDRLRDHTIENLSIIDIILKLRGC